MGRTPRATPDAPLGRLEPAACPLQRLHWLVSLGCGGLFHCAGTCRVAVECAREANRDPAHGAAA